MANITSEGYFVISYRALQELENTLSVQELMEYIEDTRKKIKAATKSPWDNDRCMVSDIYGHPFRMSLTEHTDSNDRDSTYHLLAIWDSTGSTSIGNVVFNVNGEGYAPKGTFEGIIQDMKAFSDGMVRCSHCHNEMLKSEIAGQYFAGVYCEECWTTKPDAQHPYKWIEAHETYN